MTVDQLETEIATRLKVYIVEPEVTVSITEFRSQPVSVVGAVATPGVHQLEGQKTAGGNPGHCRRVRPDAGPSVKITRRLEFGRIPLPGAADDPTHQFSIAEVNLKAVMEAKNPEYNIAIRPHDVISVPHAEVVYVIGEVSHAGALPLNEGDSLSALEAISSSGGMLRTAAVKNARILRPVPGQQKRSELSRFQEDHGRQIGRHSPPRRRCAGDSRQHRQTCRVSHSRSCHYGRHIHRQLRRLSLKATSWTNFSTYRTDRP